jgi:hypothetical protein
MEQEFKTPLDLIDFLQSGHVLYNEKLSDNAFVIRGSDNNIVDSVNGDILHFSHLHKVSNWGIEPNFNRLKV